MVQRREVVLVCDLCGTEGDLVETHRIVVDGNTRDAEACDSCWSSTLATFAVFATAGRAPAAKRYKKDELVQWPDTPWRFTNHAMLRMGERKVRPVDVLKVIAAPEVKRPGDTEDTEVWTRDNTKIVVSPARQVIQTVAKINSPTLAKAI